MSDVKRDEFEAKVKAEVERILSSRDEAQAHAEAEQALQEAKELFDTFKTKLEAKDAKIAEYEEALAALDTSEPTDGEVATNERIVELETELEEWKRIAEVAQAALDTLAREETASGRMAQLAEAGVSLDEEAAEAQYAKVRDMADDAFASYMSELVALKSKYDTSPSEEDGEDTKVAELSTAEVATIAESLGCDPADSNCISLVNEVAQKVSEVSSKAKKSVSDENATDEGEGKESEAEVAPRKETASTKLSLADAISKSLDHEIKAPASLKEEMTQAWEAVIAEKRGEKQS